MNPADFVEGVPFVDPYRNVDLSQFDPSSLSFAADLQSAGYLPGPEIEDPPEPRSRAAWEGIPFVRDDATGFTYSIEEWEHIKSGKDTQAIANYEAAKVTTPAIQEILNQPQFASQARQWRTINFRNADGEWDTRQVPVTGSPNQGVTGPIIGGPIQSPIEDLGISSLSPTNPWETRTFDFRVGDGYSQWMSFTSRERRERLKAMRNEGLLSDEQFEIIVGGGTTTTSNMGVSGFPVQIDGGGGGSPFDLTAMAIWEQATSLSAVIQKTPYAALAEIGKLNRVTNANNTRGSSGYARSVPKYSVPASLRTIPDYKALAQESKGLFRQSMGRDLEDWELAILAEELGTQYTKRNDQMIVAHKAAWNDAVAGGSTEVDYSEVTEPTSALEFDIEERYANELDRQERVEDRALSRRVLMDSITTGQRMI